MSCLETAAWYMAMRSFSGIGSERAPLPWSFASSSGSPALVTSELPAAAIKQHHTDHYKPITKEECSHTEHQK